MLKAIVNYSKKVPAETEYSSQGYSLSLETEIAAGDPASIQAQIICCSATASSTARRPTSASTWW